MNNAGIIVNGPVEGLSLDDLSRQLDVKVTAQIGVTQAVLPKIRESRIHQGDIAVNKPCAGIKSDAATHPVMSSWGSER